jgi:hypothetical protein
VKTPQQNYEDGRNGWVGDTSSPFWHMGDVDRQKANLNAHLESAQRTTTFQPVYYSSGGGINDDWRNWVILAIMAVCAMLGFLKGYSAAHANYVIGALYAIPATLIGLFGGILVTRRFFWYIAIPAGVIYYFHSH